MLYQVTDTNPFILTLEPEETAAVFFNGLRQQYFPAEKNFLKAHLTLFHYLPLTAETIRMELMEKVAVMQAFTIQVTSVASIGKGVAYKLESKALQQLHKVLQQVWLPFLKPQDVQKLWPHITVQNKVKPEVARETLLQLNNHFQPFTFRANGVSIWKYLGGPWQFIETVYFAEGIHP